MTIWLLIVVVSVSGAIGTIAPNGYFNSQKQCEDNAEKVRLHQMELHAISWQCYRLEIENP